MYIKTNGTTDDGFSGQIIVLMKNVFNVATALY